MKVVVKNLQKRIRINLAEIERVAHKIPRPTRFRNLTVVIYCISEQRIRLLKKRFFGMNVSTDVIVFPLDAQSAEVFIAPTVIKRQARHYRVTFIEELYRCVIHGVLHVYGFCDETKRLKETMWRAQESYLRKTLKARKRFRR